MRRIGAERVLSERELNRALLARQSLLEPAGAARCRPPSSGWAACRRSTRRRSTSGSGRASQGLERRQVTRALERRAIVQATLLRNTIHVVSPRDLWQFAEATRDCRRSAWLKARAKLGPDRRAVRGRGQADAAPCSRKGAGHRKPS